MPSPAGGVMNFDAHHKITADHLSRQAYLYVRQSTLRQVLENTESTKRQYALARTGGGAGLEAGSGGGDRLRFGPVRR